MDLVLRNPTIEDAADLGRAHQQSWVETVGAVVTADFWEHSTEARRIGMWERMLRRSDDARRLCVAEIDGVIVGAALAGPPVPREHPDHPPVCDLEIRILFLLRAHHGSGIGQKLLDSVFRSGEDAQVWVVERDLLTRAFYRRNGFVADGGRDSRKQPSGDLSAIRMLRAGSHPG